MNIADRIQNLRKARGISQEELADKIGVSRQAVSKWESEQSTPDIETENRTAGKWCSPAVSARWANMPRTSDISNSAQCSCIQWKLPRPL